MRLHIFQSNSIVLKKSAGFSLIEVLIAVSIFLIIGGGVYFTYANIIDVLGRTRTRTLGTSLLNKHVEMIRNLPFDNIGIVGGYPVGVIPASTTVSYEGNQFIVSATVRNVDDPFDGKQGQSPNDTAPADYRLIELTVTCPTCFNFSPLTFTTWAAPQNLESSTRNGSLFVSVFDANGAPVADADVLVRNTAVSPSISITDATNNSGTLQLVDVPTSTNAYQITVSKTGYTSRRTYTLGDTANPNPVQPHATVASQQITATSFAIDRVSSIDVFTHDQYCAAVPSVALRQNGQKKIGTGPDVLLYSQTFTTDSAGVSVRSGLEWDTYTFSVTSALYDLAGSVPLLPFAIAPNTTTSLSVFVEPEASSSLLVTTVSPTGTPLLGALVTAAKTGFSAVRYTGRSMHSETDWSGGRYASQDGAVSYAAPSGSLTIQSTGGRYATNTSSFVESNTIDFGTASTTFYDFSWTPLSQPTNTSLKFQLASAEVSGGPWNYYGPDGSSSSFYTATSSVGTLHNGKRYLRYKAFLNTTSESQTPQLNDLSLIFSSACVPSGQTLFAIPTGSYVVTATLAGHEVASSTMTVGSGFQELVLTIP